MNHDIFELTFKLTELNVILKSIGTLMILKERRESGTINKEEYNTLLNALAASLVGSTDA